MQTRTLHSTATSSAGRIGLPLLLSMALALAIVVRIIVAVLETAPEDLAGQALPGPDRADSAPPRVDLEALQALDLFSGQAGIADVVARQLPADSRLNLQLQGVILGGQPETSVAVIVSNARQDTYHAGDSLPGAGAIVLDSIAADHVIVNNNGRPETLWLYAGQGDAAPGRTVPAAPNSAVPLEVTGRLGGTTADGLPVVAATLAEIIRVQPAQENGQLIGYRLAPGEKLKEFVQLGLETNDVVTQVNGLALNDMANMPKLYALMNEATEVSFLLLREGKPMTLRFALADAP